MGWREEMGFIKMGNEWREREMRERQSEREKEKEREDCVYTNV